MTFLNLWCEWDYGQDDYLFTSEETAKAWLWKQILANGDFADEFPGGIEQVFGEGLAGFSIKTVIS